eukprot:jgi/Chlat1/5009/Chrsp32S04981
MGACASRRRAPAGGDYDDDDDVNTLAKATVFTVNEVEALRELFNSVSNSVHQDGLIHRDEFALALFNSAGKRSVFADRVFDIFDAKRNDVIEFGEFVRALSVFHPRAEWTAKADFAFRIYDIKSNGVIEREEVETLLLAFLRENPDLDIPPEALADLIDETFQNLPEAHRDHFTREEWRDLVRKNPAIIANMTIPMLHNLTSDYPSFVFHSNVSTPNARDR